MEYTNYEPKDEDKQVEKMNMADCFITAMFLPKEYGKLLRISAGRLVGYLALLLLLVSVIQYGIPPLAAITGMGGIKNIILNEIPDFSMKDGVFFFGEKYEKQDEDMGVYIMVDTDTEKFTKEDIPVDAVEAVLVSKSNMLMYNSVAGIGGLIQENVFKRDFKGLEFDNQMIADQSLLIYGFLVFLFIGMYIASAIKYLVMGLFYAIAIYLLAKAIMADMTYGTVYKIALFAQSVGAVILAAAYCIGSVMLILAASTLNMLLTIMLMNRALMQLKLEREAGV
ncbi:MAG: DUF1189 domain-containing protein [Bacteroidales bacterium]|nr:DUF1189 domain-containing protein [Clostridium sp.]MCM1203219.1 DUF1189 domain-containing protein [Bacteroidales bacterium]